MNWRANARVHRLDTPGNIDAVALCGAEAITRGSDGVIRVFDTRTGGTVRSFPTRPGNATSGYALHAVDAASLLGPLGSLAGDELREGLELLGDDALAPLGTAVVSRGGSPGQVAMRVTIHRAGWPTPAPLDVRIGQVVVVPLARGLEAELVIEPGHGVSLGTGRRSPRVTARAMGGSSRSRASTR